MSYLIASNNLVAKHMFIGVFILSVLNNSIQVYSTDHLELNYQHSDINEALPNTTTNCPDNSIGIYPDCKCTYVNFDYSVLLNVCFRVCPEHSTGYWPNCKCDDGVFVKEKFECIECPWDTVGGTYPNCICEDESSKFNVENVFCETCPLNSTGIFPNCVCDDGAEYYVERNECKKCPAGSTGIHPNCVCEKGSKFDGEFCRYCPRRVSHGNYGECICNGNKTYIKDTNTCEECPRLSVGRYPNCTCSEPFVYHKQINFCINCPAESTGVYPNCTCTEPYVYDNKTSYCMKCPTRSTGVYPNCVCENGIFKEGNFKCIECPNYSTGIYPKCECTESDEVFSAFINECYIPCGDNNATGVYPKCICDDKNTYYNFESHKCENILGAKCPENSIGVGPDCLCMDEEHIFTTSPWRCFYVPFGFTPESQCPDSSERWPQCSVSIDHKVLASSVG